MMKTLKQLLWSLLLLVFDVFILVAIFRIVWFVRANILPVYFPEFFHDKKPLIFINEYFWIIIYWPILFLYEELYWKILTFWEETKRLLLANSVAAIMVLLLIGFARVWLISRSLVFMVWLISIFLFPVARYYFKLALFSIGFFRNKVILYGAGLTGKSVLNGLSKHPELGIDVIGFIDNNNAMVGKYIGEFNKKKISVIAGAEEFLSSSQTASVDEIIITISEITRERLIKKMERCSEVVHRVSFVPDIFGAAIYTASFDCIDTALVMKFEQNLSKPLPRIIKRIFDIVLSSILIIILAPIWIGVYIAIKLDTGGDVFYRQKRVAKKTGFFAIWKYRSMVTDSGKILEEYLSINPEAKEEWDKFRKIKGFDPRVTRVGRFIRKWSLDELPQLFNVFLGHMSLVGPRPYLPDEIQDMGDFKDIITKARPGITGFWQVSGRSNLTFNDRLRLDAFYVKNWSVWLDISMLFKTIPVIFHKEGAY